MRIKNHKLKVTRIGLLVVFILASCILISGSRSYTMAVAAKSNKSIQEKKKKLFKVYSDVIKEGDIAYCGGTGIYKVNLRTGKVITLKNNKDWYDSRFTDMKKIGSWIYFKKDGEVFNYLYRVNVHNKKCEKIAPKILPSYPCYIGNLWYYIKGSKIYLTTIYDGYYDGCFNAVTNLNGKGEKRTNKTIINKTVTKKSNVAGYKLIYKYNHNYFVGEGTQIEKIWLKTPKKKYFIKKKSIVLDY